MTETGGTSSDAWLRARVAWMYFVAGVPQNQIAEIYGMSRATVNRIVARTRAEGLVKVQLTVPLGDCLDLADRLQTRFGLDHAIVIPSAPDYAAMQRTIGETAGDHLDVVIRERAGLALGWGRTLSFAVNRLTPPPDAGFEVVGLMGARPFGSTSNPFEVIAAAARMTGGSGHYLTLPIVVPDAATRRSMTGHPEIEEVLSIARRAEVALVACGDLSDRNLIMSVGAIRDARDALVEAGAVGDLLGTFLDAMGRPVDHPILEQMVAVPIAALREKKVSILAAGGENKTAIIRAVLRGRYVNCLVTDEATASRLLAEDDV